MFILYFVVDLSLRAINSNSISIALLNESVYLTYTKPNKAEEMAKK
ncbi:MAG: hypothetical protein ACXWFZ_05975 [Nitrososphaeraceae archaeon]